MEGQNIETGLKLAPAIAHTLLTSKVCKAIDHRIVYRAVVKSLCEMIDGGQFLTKTSSLQAVLAFPLQYGAIRARLRTLSITYIYAIDSIS